jgi:hypothetical protein
MTDHSQTPPPVKSSQPLERRPAVSDAKSQRAILAEKNFCRTKKRGQSKALASDFALSAGAAVVADLFGRVVENHSEISKKQPEILENTCAKCGAPFSQALRQGRPLRFCSDPCRQATKASQVRQWEREHAGKPAAALITCRACQRDFEPPPRSSGRAPHWCSPSCKQTSLRKLVDRQAMPDLFPSTERTTPHD